MFPSLLCSPGHTGLRASCHWCFSAQNKVSTGKSSQGTPATSVRGQFCQHPDASCFSFLTHLTFVFTLLVFKMQARSMNSFTRQICTEPRTHASTRSLRFSSERPTLRSLRSRSLRPGGGFFSKHHTGGRRYKVEGDDAGGKTQSTSGRVRLRGQEQVAVRCRTRMASEER